MAAGFVPSFRGVGCCPIAQLRRRKFRLKQGGEEWVDMVPDFVDRVIKENCLFGFCGVNKPGKSDVDPAEAAARAIEQKD